MNARRTTFAIGFVGAGAIAAAACANVLGFDELHLGGDATTGDAAIILDAAPDVATDTSPPDSAPTCELARWPDRPDASGGGTVQFMAAVQAFDFGLAVDAGTHVPPGFDLDHFCTVTPGMNSCATSVGGTTFTTYIADKDGLQGGRDNAGFGLLTYLGSATDSIRQEALNDRLQSGAAGLLARVKNWNGLPEDPDVFVEWMPALGVVGATSLDGAPPRPAFDESDVWIRDSAYWNIATYDTSTVFDSAAYVTGGKLVARVDVLSVSLPFPAGDLLVVLRDSVVVADIVPTSTGGYRLANGAFAGRWSTVDLLASLRPLYDTAFNSYVCQSALLYQNVKSTACPARDIASREQSDNVDAGCNAISVGVRFETAAASDHKRYDARADAGDPCASSGVPSDDDCAP